LLCRQLYGAVRVVLRMRAILDGSAVDAVLERDPAGQLQLHEGSGCLRGVDPGGTNELVGCERALLEPSIERLCNRSDPRRFPGGGDEVEELEDVAGARRRRRAQLEQRVRAAGERARALPHCLPLPCSSRYGSGRTPRRKLAPTLRPGPTMETQLLLAILVSSALAKSERAWGTLRKAVVLPRVRRGLNLRHVLSFGRVEVIQPTEGAGRVRVLRGSGFIGVIRSARRTLHLTCERPTS